MRFNLAQIGDTKIISKFLIFPLIINSEGRWFEWVYYEVRYNGLHCEWVPLRFVTKEEYKNYIKSKKGS